MEAGKHCWFQLMGTAATMGKKHFRTLAAGLGC